MKVLLITNTSSEPGFAVPASAARTRRQNRRRMVGSLLISTAQANAKARTTRGSLTIRV